MAKFAAFMRSILFWEIHKPISGTCCTRRSPQVCWAIVVIALLLFLAFLTARRNRPSISEGEGANWAMAPLPLIGIDTERAPEPIPKAEVQGGPFIHCLQENTDKQLGKPREVIFTSADLFKYPSESLGG